jgi:thioredoxin 1
LFFAGLTNITGGLMSGFIQIEDHNFENEVLKSSTPVLLEFGGVWCKPCKTLEPLLLKLGEAWGDKIKLAKLDVDDFPELAMRYQVMSLPTTILFSNGEQKEVIIGLQNLERIRDKIEPHL